MSGFFEIKPQKTSRRLSCISCGLYKNTDNPKLEPIGEFEKKILIIGSVPDLVDHQKGKPFQGHKGNFLNNALERLGIDLFRDCLCTNAVACRTIDATKVPTIHQISCCRKKVFNLIQERKPKLIILLGQEAVISFLDHRWRDEKTPYMAQIRGWVIPDRETKAWVSALFDINEIINDEKDRKELKTIWKQDLSAAINALDIEFPSFTDESSKIEIVDNTDFLLDLAGPVAFDYETTGLKPHDTSKHKIICMSVCNSLHKAYAFMMPTDPKQLRNVKLFLKSDVPKIAQNMKFEHTWSKNILKCTVNNWAWDTMLATHIIDNRQAITGLKFQAYVQFGIIDYDSSIKQYLRAEDDKNGNAVNRIEELIKTEAGKEKLLVYCGIDSLLEYRLAKRQQRLFKKWEN